MEVNDIMTCIDRLPQGCSDKRYAEILKELPDECQSRIRKTFTLNHYNRNNVLSIMNISDEI